MSINGARALQHRTDPFHCNVFHSFEHVVIISNKGKSVKGGHKLLKELQQATKLMNKQPWKIHTEMCGRCAFFREKIYILFLPQLIKLAREKALEHKATYCTFRTFAGQQM